MNSTYDERDGAPRDEMWGKASAALDRGGRFLGRVGFGVFLLIAVVVTLIATTFVGVMLALAAGFLALTQKFSGRKRSGGQGGDDLKDGPPPTLEAHRTADGWVTEPVRTD